MKKSIGLISLAGIALIFSGCVSIFSSGISSSQKAGNGQTVSVTVSGDPGILHLTAPTGLTQSANKALLDKCASGTLTDVQTQLSIRDFVGIVQIYKVRASGVCKG